MSEILNLLPRPTFRWLKVNHTEVQTLELADTGVDIAIGGNVDIVRSLEQRDLLDPSYMGCSKGTLKQLLADDSKALLIEAKENSKESVYIHVKVSEEKALQKLRLRIKAEAGAELTVLYRLEGETEKESAAHLFTELDVAETASVTFVKVQLLGARTQQFEHRLLHLKEGAKADFVSVELGGMENYLNFSHRLIGNQAEVKHNLAYLGRDEQKFDVSMLMSHEGLQTKSDIHHVGALAGFAKKSFRGTLDFLRGSTGAEGAEEDVCLLLDPTVKSISLPLLLCKEDNVVGNHAASAGQIDANKLFYLMSRGFSETEAKHLIVESMLRPIIDQIGDDELAEAALAMVRGKISL